MGESVVIFYHWHDPIRIAKVACCDACRVVCLLVDDYLSYVALWKFISAVAIPNAG